MTKEEMNLHIGRRLMRRRRQLGLSLAQVSAKCGVSLQQIHRYEIGLHVVSAPRLWALSRCLGVSIGYFFDGLTEPSELVSES
jgi:transcriptional regulator with XRE-family HTH domain